MEENESIICYLFDILSSSSIPIEKKREILFKNIIVSFRNQDPLTNFINSDEGPIINMSKLTKNKEILGLVENENGELEGNIESFIIKKTYCPICGGELNHEFTIGNFYQEEVDKSTFFNKKIIYSKNPNNYYKQTSFNYIDCPKCLKNISINFDKFGKPLRNDYLYDLYLRIGKYLGLELDDDMNKKYQSRCLFPVDRLYYKLKDKLFYFNLFNLCDYSRDKFKEFCKNNLNYSDELIDDSKMKVFTKLSENIFDPDSCKDYRDFEEWIIKESEKDFLSQDFYNISMNKFDYKIIENTENGIKTQCLNNCEGCNKVLLFPSEKELFGCILLRKNFDECEAKKFLLKEEKENENMILSPEEEDKINENDSNSGIPENQISEVSQSENFSTESINEENAEEILNESEPIDEIEESLPGEVEENPIGVMIDENKNEIHTQENNNSEKNKEEIGQTDDKFLQMDVGTESETSDKFDEEEREQKNDVVTEETQENEIYDLESNISQSISNEVVNEEEIIGNFDKMEADDKEIIEQMTLETENSNYIRDETEFKDENLKTKQKVIEAIMSVDDPQPEDFVKTYHSWTSSMDPESQQKFNSVEINVKMMKGMELWFQYRAQDIQKEIELSGKEYLNRYPLLKYEDLRDYLFDIAMEEIKSAPYYQEKKKEEKPYLESSDPYDHSKNLDDEDPINKSNAFKRQIEEKSERTYQKSKDKCNVKTLFRVNDAKRTNPFVMRETLKDRYDNSVFKVVFDLVTKMEGYKAGSPIVTIDKYSLFTPVVDFPEVGVRFLCINTADTRYFTFQEPPMKLINRIPFPNEKFRNNHSINFIYSNECITRPKQVAHSIFKIVNRRFFPNDLIVRLNGRNYPLAYTIEKQAMIAMEEDYSIFSGLGRAKNSQVTIVAFVENEENNNDYAIKERMAKSIQNKGFLHNSYAGSFQNLLDTHDMAYILSAHYLEDKEWQLVNGKEEPYMHYTITQYTENTSCIIEDGLPVIVAAIIKEHYRKYPGTAYCITYEYDKTALVSPSVRKLIQSTNGIFTLDPTSYNQSITDTVTNWVISESRFQKSSKPVDDRARQDYRMFTAAESTLRAFLGNKIRPDENLSNVEKVLLSAGYFSYPEPKTQNFEITRYGLELVENSPLFYYMFPIELAKLGQENAFDSYNKAYQEILTAKFMMSANLNTPGSKELFEIIHHGGKVIGGIMNALKK